MSDHETAQRDLNTAKAEVEDCIKRLNEALRHAGTKRVKFDLLMHRHDHSTDMVLIADVYMGDGT